MKLLRELLFPAVAVLAAFAVGGLLVLAIGDSPIDTFRLLIGSALWWPDGIGYTLFLATPLIFTGLAVAVAFQAGLLNIGAEEMKGHEEIREAAELLRAMNLPQLDYIGFVEGDGIGRGDADVIVSEGFSGNIALKATEGTARQIMTFLRNAIEKSLLARIGYLLARGAFRELRVKLDPGKSNGSVLLGLNGIVVKSHGGTDAEGFASAVEVGYEMVHYDLLTKINQMLNRDGALVPAPAA